MKVNDRYVSFYYEDDNDYGRIEIDPARTALLIIDMQRVFVTRPEYGESPEEQARKEKWEPFYRRLDEVVIPCNEALLRYFRENGLDVFFAKIQCRRSDGRDRSLDHKATGYNELLLPPGHPDAEIIEPLAPMKDEIVIQKTTDSAVTGSALTLTLRNMGIDTLVVTGVLTDQCVSGTVRGLADESFKVWLIEDGCSAATRQIQEHELSVLNNIYCHVINTEECLEALKAGKL